MYKLELITQMHETFCMLKTPEVIHVSYALHVPNVTDREGNIVLARVFYIMNSMLNFFIQHPKPDEAKAIRAHFYAAFLRLIFPLRRRYVQTLCQLPRVTYFRED